LPAVKAPIRTAVAAVVLLLTAAGPALAAPASGAAEEELDLGGAPLPGGDASTDPGSPTELEAGLWADTLAGGDPPHQFTYTRTMDSSTVHLGVVAAPSDPDGDALALEAFEQGGESCASDNASTSYSTPQAAIGAAVDVGPSEPGTRDELCVRSRTITFTVSRGSSSSVSDLPIAVKIVEEAPVVGAAADLPTPAPSNPVGAPDGGSEESLEGATSFDDAPEIEGGTAYASELTEGDQRLYRVRLGWGQSLDVRAEVPAQSAELQEQFLNPTVEVSLVDPMRNVFTAEVDDATGSGSYGSEPLVLSEGVPPLFYLRRFEDAVASLPGDYWVVLNAQPAVDREPLDIPVTLTVQVRGDEGGAPAYPDAVTGPGGSGGPDGYAADTPFLVGDGEFSADPSGNPPPSASDDDGGFGPRRIGGAALLVVSLALCVAGALRLRRRPV
jgi:hypothetical protein